MNTGEIILYQGSEGNIKIDVRLEDETVWLTQAQMGMLFNKDKRTISEHISNIFKEGELNEDSVVRNFRTTTQHGAIADKTQQIEVKTNCFVQFTAKTKLIEHYERTLGAINVGGHLMVINTGAALKLIDKYFKN